MTTLWETDVDQTEEATRDASRQGAPDDGNKGERRAAHRYFGNAQVTVVRDRDQTRIGVEGKLHDVSFVGLSLLLPAELHVGEYVMVKLENHVHRVKVQVRGQVRHVQPPIDGWFRVGIAPMTRLTLREIEGLRTRQKRGRADHR